MFRPVLIAALLALPLVACHDEKPKLADAVKETPRQPTVFDDQLKALEKAKAVEKQMQQDKARQDQAIDEAAR